MSLKRPADSGLPDDEPAQKRARTVVDDELPPVPLVYQEGKKILDIALWYPGRVDEAKRKIIYKGLRGENEMGWVSFLQSGDYEESEGFVPKEFEGLTLKDLGVVRAKEVFCFDECYSPESQ